MLNRVDGKAYGQSPLHQFPCRKSATSWQLPRLRLWGSYREIDFGPYQLMSSVVMLESDQPESYACRQTMDVRLCEGRILIQHYTVRSPVMCLVT